MMKLLARIVQDSPVGWWLALWGILTLAVLIPEFWGLFVGGRTPPLTKIIVRYIPEWMLLPLIALLFVHFVIAYHRPGG